jgi:hypothetical protein
MPFFFFLRRDEVRTLRSQLECLQSGRGGDIENIDNLNSEASGTGEAGNMFFGLKTDNKNALILNQYRNHVEELSLKHLSDLSRLRGQLEEKVGDS